VNGDSGDPDAVRALLLAGGLGTRLRPLTDHVPKCLVEIDGRPLLDYWLERLARGGIRRVRVNNHHHPEAMRAYLRRARAEWGLRVEEAHEPVLLGSAGTVAANRDLADGAREVVVAYGDNLSDVDLTALLRFHRSHGDPFTMLLFRTPTPRACGIAETDREGRVLSFVEKPERPASDLANAGVYVLSADAYREIADLRAFDLAFDVLPRFVGRMRGYAFDGYHRDVGTPQALEAARREAPAVFARRASEAR
jgi:NDP-sugar pyrophosphorylase family protein